MASALALLKEESVRSYPSWIAELKGKSPAGMELRRYAYEHLEPGEPSPGIQAVLLTTRILKPLSFLFGITDLGSRFLQHSCNRLGSQTQ
jgi:hypothetical protein